MIVTIDHKSGFCFGVTFAIEAAEEELKKSGKLFCLGDIVHNNMEMARLRKLGLEVISHDQLESLFNVNVMIRAHGEPPETYQIALKNNLTLMDATCPVVLKLQQRVRNGFSIAAENQGQIVIYGKEGHAEVIGLVGQTHQKAIIISKTEDLDRIDYTKPVYLYSQTTQGIEGYAAMVREIRKRLKSINPSNEPEFIENNTICRLVANRSPQLKSFALAHDVILFVSGLKSSNGIYLYSICKESNPNSYLISNPEDIQDAWFNNKISVGICGATSTPMWLMESIADIIRNKY